MIKKVCIGVLSLLVLVVMTAIFVPLIIDINSYKPALLAKVQENLGREVTIDGDISFRLLPSPQINIATVKLGNIPGASQPMMGVIKTVRLQLAFWSLLHRHLHFKSIEIVEPDIVFETTAAGQPNWVFNSSETFKTSSTTTATSPSTPSVTSSSLNIDVQKLSITDGRVSYKQGTTVHEIHHLTSDFSAASLQGPYKGEGQFTYEQEKIAFMVNLGAYQESQPIELKLMRGDMTGTLMGMLSASHKTFTGDTRIEGKWTKAEKQKLGSGVMSGSGFRVEAKTVASARGIILDPLKIQVGETQATGGSLQIRLEEKGTLQGTLKNSLGGLFLHFTITPQKGVYKGHVEGNIENILDSLQQMGLNMPTVTPDLLNGAAFTSDLTLYPQELCFSKLHLDLLQTQIKGNVSVLTSTPNPSFKVDLKASNIQLLGLLTGLPLQILGDEAALKGIIEQSTDQIKLDLNTSFGQLTIQSQGLLDHLSSEPSVNVHLKIANSRGKGVILTKGHNPTLSLNETVFVEGQLSGQGQTFKLDHFKGNLGSMGSVTGMINYTHLGERPSITADLQFGALHLDPVFALFSHQSNRMPSFSQPSLSLHQVAFRVGSLPFATAQKKSELIPVAPWSRSPLDLSFLNFIDLSLKASSPSITKESMVLTDVNFVADLKKGKLVIDQLKGKMYGGDILLKGFTQTQDNKSDYTFSATEVELKNFIATDANLKIAQGKMNVQGHLQFQGNSVYALVSHLQGTISLQAHDGVVSGFNLQSIIAHLKNANRLQGISQLLTQSFDKGQTAFSTFHGKAVIRDGKAQLQDVQLKAEGGDGTAEGIIDLPSYVLDVFTRFMLTDIKALPPLEVRFTGPIDQPERSINGQAFQEYMLRNVVNLANGLSKSVTSGKIKPADVLGAILGQQSSNTTPPAASNQNTDTAQMKKAPSGADKPSAADVAQNPEKVVKNLLKGLF